MTLIVKTITRLTVGLILIYGIYILLSGHISPGGGFAGGLIIALSFIHLVLAYGKDRIKEKIDEIKGLILSSAAALAFLVLIALGALGIYKASAASQHYKIFSSGLIPYCDIAVALVVGSALFVVFLILVLLAGKKER